MATAEAAVSEQLRQQIESEMEVKYAEKFRVETESFKKTLLENNKTAIENVIADYRKKMEPPKPEDVQKLLEQEYLTFKVKLPFQPKSGKKQEKQERTFIIRELPQEVERKFYSRLKEKLLVLTSEAESMKMTIGGTARTAGDIFQNALSLLNAFEPMLDVMAYVTALALNPYDEDKDVTEDWVRANLSSSRQMQIVDAQVMCNRSRDFFSWLSKGSRSLT